MNKFRIGDKVKIMKPTAFSPNKVGDEGIIERISCDMGTICRVKVGGRPCALNWENVENLELVSPVLIVGEKYTPIKKSVNEYGELVESASWRFAQSRGQNYLYYKGISSYTGNHIFAEDMNIAGDFFMPEDMIHYQEEEKQEAKKKVDFTVAGTKLPMIPKGTEYTSPYLEDYPRTRYQSVIFRGFNSHGSRVINGEVWILAEEDDYTGENQVIYKLSTIESLAEQQGMLYEQTNKTNNMQTISRESLKVIYDQVCTGWMGRIDIELAKQPFSSIIEVDDEILQEAFRQADSKQKELLLKYFKEPVPQFQAKDLKVGEVMKVTDTCKHMLRMHDRLLCIEDLSYSWNEVDTCSILGEKLPSGTKLTITAK